MAARKSEHVGLNFFVAHHPELVEHGLAHLDGVFEHADVAQVLACGAVQDAAPCLRRLSRRGRRAYASTLLSVLSYISYRVALIGFTPISCR